MNRYVLILTIINSIAAVHGIFLSLILGFKKKNRKANHFLAFMVFSVSIGMLGPIYILSQLYIQFWWLSPLFNSIPFCFGPLLYFYIKALTHPQFCFKKMNWLHFLPAIMALFYYMSVFFKSADERQIYFNGIYFQVSLSTYLSIFFSFTQIFIYIILCLKLLKYHSEKIKESYSALEKVNLSWIRHLVILFISSWIISMVVQSVFPQELLAQKIDDAITYFLLTMFIFSIGYRGLSQPEIFTLLPNEQPGEESESKDEVTAKKYEKTGLTVEQSIRIKEQLLRLMEENRPYLSPDLTLSQISEMLNMTVHQMSQVINDNMGINFYRFINSYRVKEAMQRLRDSRTKDDKLIKIAFDSGFNSLSTFNRVFKDFTGKSPSQFKRFPSSPDHFNSS